MKLRYKVEGLRELNEVLREIPKASGRNTLRKVLRKHGKPMAEEYRAGVRVDEGDLRDRSGVGTRLTRRQKRQHKKMFASDKASVEIFVGAPGLTQAITEEFGTVDQAPQGTLRRVWDHWRGVLVGLIARDLGEELMKALARFRARAARKARG